METRNVNVSYKTGEKKGKAVLWSTDQFEPETKKAKQDLIFNPNHDFFLNLTK